jgi:hypothetical protein
MPIRLLSLVALACAALAMPAQAERRMFIIANDSGGYGVDRCLASGDKCGAPAANAYCKSHRFAAATSYRKIDRDDITGAVPTAGGSGCKGASCDEFVAIECMR